MSPAHLAAILWKGRNDILIAVAGGVLSWLVVRELDKRWPPPSGRKTIY